MIHNLDNLDCYGEDWWDAMSDDRNDPSCFTVREMGKIGLYEHVVTVMPGERLSVFRNGAGMIVVGFLEVTIH